MRIFHVQGAEPLTPALILAPVLACALTPACLIFAGCVIGEYRAGTGAYRDGLWEGSGRGHEGVILVQVRLASGLIQEIGITAHNEDPLTGGEAMEELLEQILDYQSTDLDAVSGATESCAGFLAAVEDALNRAAAP